MEIAVTDGIVISVETQFENAYSKPCECCYYFSYRIGIENNSTHSVQLQRRKWMIFDSVGSHMLVEGSGVVGQQPIIAPGEYYSYESACKLNSEMGKMWGIYFMKRCDDEQEISVKIPEFNLIVPHILN